MYTIRGLGVSIACAFAAPAWAQLNNLDEAIRTTPITSQEIAEGLHVLLGVGGNIAASIGDDGVLVVDTQFPGMAPKYKDEIGKLGGGEIDFAINTHWHFDHADGNQVLGPDGTWIVSQTNSRDMMTKDNVINLVSQTRQQAAYPEAALPVFTFDEAMQLDFNGERIELLHFGPAHTNGDTAVIFRGTNAVHLGDVFNNAGYPFVDADNGGSLTGIIDFCRAVLERIDPQTTVVPGHGPVTDYAELEAYVSMLSEIRDKIVELIEQGATLEQVVAAAPTAQWDDEQGDPANFLNRAYTSLTR
jgi:cyclase